MLADSNGTFPANATKQSWQDDDLGAFKWSTRNSVIHVGDFNDDGRSDLLVQGLPQIVLIDFDVAIPVPHYPPGSHGVAYSQGGAAPFQLGGINLWDRHEYAVDWSPRTNNVIVGDFDGNGTDDVLLQSRRAGGGSVLLGGNVSGNVFSSTSTLPASVGWSADGYRLIAGNFDGGAGTGVYWQAQSPGGTNYYSNSISSGGVSLSTHGSVQPAAIVPATAVGRTPGSFQVSHAGTATYRVPLWMPPGPRQIQPNLDLTYDSGQGNGVLGVGWSLSGLSSIQRCNRTAGQDQNGGAVTLTDADAFCLNGQRLQLTSGIQGAANSTYRLEIDDFSTVTASAERAGNGPQYFLMRDKRGITYEYGRTTDSRVLPAFAANTPFRWKLNKVSDQYGNSYVVTYQNAGGHAVPATLSWAPISPGGSNYLYTATFNYITNRPEEDSTITYVAAHYVANSFRLENVEIRSSASGAAQIVRKYVLGYEASPTTKRSRLTSIQECADDTVACLQPTVIAYHNGQPGVNANALPGPSSISKLLALQRDYNGDGRDDLLYAVDDLTWYVAFAVNGGFSSPYNTGISSAINPIADRFLSNGQDGFLAPLNGVWHYYSWNEATASFSVASTGAAVASNMTSTSAALTDITGDGLYDLAWVVNNNQIYVLDNITPAGATVPVFAASPRLMHTVTNYTGARIQLYHDSRTSRADFDGDGRRDLGFVAIQPTGGSFPPQIAFGVLFARGTHFEVSAGPLQGTATAEPAVPLYFNDDDCVDRRIRNTIHVQKCGPSEPETLTLPRTPRLMLDWDGDGRTDFLVDNGATFGVIRSRGNGLSAIEPTSVPHSSTLNYFPMDQDGDGRDDIMASSSGAVSFYTRTGAGSVPLFVNTWPDLASSFTDGFGVSYAPAYVSTAKDPEPSASPIGGGRSLFRAPEPRIVVGQVTFSDGTGGAYNKSYEYEGGIYDRARLEYTAFSGRTETDSRSQLQRKLTYEFAFPRTGLVKRDELLQANGTTPIQVTVTEYQDHSYTYNGGNNRYLPYARNVTAYRYELGNALNGTLLYTSATTNTVDAASGALTDSVTTITEAIGANGLQSGVTHSVAIHHELFNDFGNSCFGLPETTREVRSNSIPSSGQTITRRTKTTWNGQYCRPAQYEVEPLSAEYHSTTVYQYEDPFGNVSSITVTPVAVQGREQAPRTTIISWDTTGQFPTTVTNPKSQVTSYEWNKSLGAMIRATDPNHLTTRWYPDVFGRVLQESRPDGTRTESELTACRASNSYCGGGAADLRVKINQSLYDTTGASVRTDAQYADGFERVRFADRQLLNGSISRIAVAYDSFGRRSTESVPYIVGTQPDNTTYGYDALGRMTSMQRQTSVTDQTLSRITVNHLGLRREVIDERSSPTRMNVTIVDVLGRVVRAIDAAGTDTDYVYDAFGNLLRTTDVDGNQILLTYNQLGWKLTSNDPDMGAWTYTYYPLGELASQQDANGALVRFEYDGLSRLTRRIEPEGETNFNFDTAAHGIGQLGSVTTTAPGSYSETFTYDSLSRLQQRSIAADGVTYDYRYDYNPAGLLDTLTYPTSTSAAPFKVRYAYQYGVMSNVGSYVSDVPGTIYWQARGNSMNAWGQYDEEEFGNGLRTSTGFDRITGWVDHRTTGLGGGGGVQNLAYEWYKTGNLRLRRDLNRSLAEEFIYDSLDRLDRSYLNSVENLDVNYDELGNIAFKSDVGTYHYEHGTKKHAVTRIDGDIDNVYTYDANGNMRTRNGAEMDWFSYNLPRRIRNSATTWSEFSYNHSRERWKQQISVDDAVETVTYIGGLFEKRQVGAEIEYRHLVVGGNGPVAYVERTEGGASTTSTYYVSTDHLGSTNVITDENGAVLVSESFDAFGQRRGSNWTGVPSSSDLAQIATTTRRGFTFHEHLDNLNLVHMNGRVFDPKLGRFMSADPLVQSPYDSQSFNRYSYTFNNPLTFTDPSGFSSWCISFGFGGGADTPDGGDFFGLSFSCRSWYFSDPKHSTYAPVTSAEWTKPGADSTVGRTPFTSFAEPGSFSANAGYRFYSDPNISPATKEAVAVGGFMLMTGGTIAFSSPTITSLFTLATAPQAISDGMPPGFNAFAGGGAKLTNLAFSDALRIQNAVNRTGVSVTVVGSRASGRAGALSDWDYVLPAGTPSRVRHSLSSSLPEGPRGIGEPRLQDFFMHPIDTSLPHITFHPVVR